MWKKIGIATLVIAIVGAIIGWQQYRVYFGQNVPDELSQTEVHIPTGSTFEEVTKILYDGGFLMDTVAFRKTANFMAYHRPQMRAGKFEIQPRWSSKELVSHLRGGKQVPVQVVLTSERLPENIAAKAARFIESDSTDLWRLMQNQDYLKSIGYTPETLTSLFIPNTYEFYWNTSAKEFLERMQKEHDKFWDKNNRREKAKSKGMTPEEVYTLASIVEKETNFNPEKKRMAGVYLNRIKRGMLLQADPTSVFARRDFAAKRVTDYHTKFDSPYNTYIYAGLPPGPIAMASISSIDAVLNAEDHSYLYFCAKGDGTGEHNFAKSLSAHNQNAQIYVNNLKKRGLR